MWIKSTSLWFPLYPTLHHFPHNFLCSCFKSLSPLSAACMCLGIGPSTGAWIAFQGTTSLKKTYFPSTSSCQLPIGPQLEVRLPEPLHTQCCDLESLILMHSVTAAVSSSIQWTCHVKKTLFWCSHPAPLAVTIFLSLLQCDLWALKAKAVKYTLQPLLCTLPSYESLYCSPSTKKRFLWWGLRDAQIYEYKDKNLGSSLSLGLVSIVMLVGSPLEPVTYQATGSWPSY